MALRIWGSGELIRLNANLHSAARLTAAYLTAAYRKIPPRQPPITFGSKTSQSATGFQPGVTQYAPGCGRDGQMINRKPIKHTSASHQFTRRNLEEINAQLMQV